MGAYENPITVVDTESSKYWAQAISNIGQYGAKAIDDINKRKRALAAENKKRNRDNLNKSAKYSAEYLAAANKLTKDFDLRGYIGAELSELVTQAANTKVALENATTSSERTELKRQLVMYEQFFNGGGLHEAIENFAGERKDFSDYELNAGKEGGLSLSGTNANLYEDLGSTFRGSKTKPLKVYFEEIDGALNMKLSFGGGGTYNANKDFGPETILLNPDFNTGISKVLEEAQITVGEKPNENSQAFQNLVTGKRIAKNGMWFNEISKTKLTTLLASGLEGQVGGILKSGRASEGDLGMGYRQIQSYVNDILGEDKILKLDLTEESGLTKESWAWLRDAIIERKREQIENGLTGTPIAADEQVGVDTAVFNSFNEMVNAAIPTMDEGMGYVSESGETPATATERVRSKVKEILRSKKIDVRENNDLLYIIDTRIRQAEDDNKTVWINPNDPNDTESLISLKSKKSKIQKNPSGLWKVVKGKPEEIIGIDLKKPWTIIEEFLTSSPLAPTRGSKEFKLYQDLIDSYKNPKSTKSGGTDLNTL